jgi:PAS domain S-box-containing protein
MKTQSKANKQILEKNQVLMNRISTLEVDHNVLRRENAFLEDLLDSSSSISIMSTDLQGDILFWNKGAENIFGYKAEEVIGKQKVDILYPDDETKEKIKEKTGSILEKKAGLSFEIREISKDNRILWIHLTLTPRFDHQGNVVGILGIGEDITDRVKAEQALQNSQQQLHQAQKMEALGTLVAGAAHEINNPVNLIALNLSTLEKIWTDLLPVIKEQANSDPEKKYGGLTYDFLKENLGQLISDMDLASDRIAKIISDLKNFARQSNVVDKEEIQINTAVKNASRLAKTTLENSGINLELNLSDNLPLIFGNPHSIEQIILNILINAAQAINHNHGKIKVSTQFYMPERQVKILISDNGAGIAPDLLDKIFDPFVTDKQTQGGTGLGLSVTYSLVKAHNGEIEFETKSNNGATFIVSFPCGIKHKATRILIADDDSSIREILAEALGSGGGYHINQAANGTEANIKLGTFCPDILVLDLLMPKMDGLEVCRAIKKEPAFSDMKVIITTGFQDDPKLEEIIQLGFTNICYKPLDIGAFLKQVNDLLIS